MTSPRRQHRRHRTWKLRTTLTVTIAGLFTAATGTVLTVQYLLTTHALDQQVQTAEVTSSEAEVHSGGPTGGVTTQEESLVCVNGADLTNCPASSVVTPQKPDPADVRQTITTVRDTVVQTMRTSLIAIFATFTALALAIAWAVAARTSRRITTISEMADRLDPGDLSQRLPGASTTDEIGQLATCLNGMLERIERSVHIQRQFIANASHELRTPVAAVQTSLDAPLSQGRFPPDVQPAVLRALAANSRSTELINSLLELAHAQGHPGGPRQDVDVAIVARQALDAVHARCLAAQISVDVTGLRAAPVEADLLLLELAVRNLLENAVKHNTPVGTIQLTTRHDGTSAHLVVTNTTTPTDDGLDALTQPFHRGANTRITGTEGFGIGLAIVDAVAQRHNGRLDLSRPTPSTFAAEFSITSHSPTQE